MNSSTKTTDKTVSDKTKATFANNTLPVTSSNKNNGNTNTISNISSKDTPFKKKISSNQANKELDDLFTKLDEDYSSELKTRYGKKVY